MRLQSLPEKRSLERDTPNVKVQVLSAARNDTLRQIDYYQDEAESAQVSERFLIALEAAFEQLRKMPHMGAPRQFNHPELTRASCMARAGVFRYSNLLHSV
ncbi:type II toxin-antitoxin system RelE/ParE family toxin [Telmatobacter bradus]|uniref:type II toxin-antitoxin system RelE/ParE family toxin n=1 Tax=Telmatobacter bradus TaxID=474953 RepID=UPI003B428945